MSKNSDLIKQHINKASSHMHERLTGEPEDMETIHAIKASDIKLDEDPMFVAQLGYYNAKTLNLVRRVFREVSGSEPFPDSATAVQTVIDKLIPQMVAIPLQALADGLQVTTDSPSFAVKKYTRMDKMGDIYNSEVFTRDSELIAMEYLGDPDCVELVTDMLSTTVYSLGVLTGYKDYIGDDLTYVWDLFLLTGRSNCTSMYLAGRELGQHVTEEDALAGILAATERQES